MSSICAVSALTPLPNSNTTNGTKNVNNCNKSGQNGDNHTTESQEILNNLKLIKEKIELNGIPHKEVNKEVNNCSNNGFNGLQTSDNNNSQTSLPLNKPLKIDINSEDQFFDGNGGDFYSEASTLSSSPITSPIDECMGAINEELLEQKFSKFIVNDLSSPIIQINGIDGFDEEEEDDFDKIRAPLLRSTSLKTGKTPPGTPQRKKIVRFADAMGLDLESVRHIISDDLPNVPQSAFGSLKSNEKTDSDPKNKQIPWFMQKPVKLAQNRPNLMLEFIQPSSLLNFMDRVRNNKVCLENCVVSNSAGNLSINCIIRVLNISFEKSVTLRFTTNGWLTSNEALASYIPNSCDGFSDKFSVTFSVSAGGYCLTPGQRLLFALKYLANGEEYWDNNMGLNYSCIYRV